MWSLKIGILDGIVGRYSNGRFLKSFTRSLLICIEGWWLANQPVCLPPLSIHKTDPRWKWTPGINLEKAKRRTSLNQKSLKIAIIYLGLKGNMYAKCVEQFFHVQYSVSWNNCVLPCSLQILADIGSHVHELARWSSACQATGFLSLLSLEFAVSLAGFL
jgi:hypothetical protein